MATFYRLTRRSANRKTGPIPVSTTSSSTCPASCPFNGGNGCYATQQPLLGRWREVDRGEHSTGLDEFCDSIAALPDGTLWRHNQAGDLPGSGDEIDETATLKIIEANEGKRGFTYTHKPVIGNPNNAMLVAHANSEGFTINLSGNNPQHADQLADLGIGPVVTVLPVEIEGNVKLATPAGRRIVVCPATYNERVSCASCGLCQHANRNVIVGFPAHGAGKKRASSIARGE